MSDYLGYLAQMTLGVIPALEPRPASRFDPAAPMEVGGSMAAANEVAEPAERSPLGDAAVMVEPYPSSRRGTGSAGVERERRSRMASVQANTEGDAVDRSVIPPSRPDMFQTPPSRAEGEDTRPRRTEPPLEEAPSAPRPRPDTAMPEPPVRPAHRPLPTFRISRTDEPPSDDLPAAGSDTRADRNVAAHDDRPIVREGVVERAAVLKSEPPVPWASIVPVAGPLPERAVRPESRRMPPTIQVTIGRVEVRAVQPPPAPLPPPISRPPELTLDDYLKSREGELA